MDPEFRVGEGKRGAKNKLIWEGGQMRVRQPCEWQFHSLGRGIFREEQTWEEKTNKQKQF